MSFQVGDTVEVLGSDGRWAKATVSMCTEDGQYEVKFHGWSPKWNEIINADNIRNLSPPLEARPRRRNNKLHNPEALFRGKHVYVDGQEEIVDINDPFLWQIRTMKGHIVSYDHLQRQPHQVLEEHHRESRDVDDGHHDRHGDDGDEQDGDEQDDKSLVFHIMLESGAIIAPGTYVTNLAEVPDELFLVSKFSDTAAELQPVIMYSRNCYFDTSQKVEIPLEQFKNDFQEANLSNDNLKACKSMLKKRSELFTYAALHEAVLNSSHDIHQHATSLGVTIRRKVLSSLKKNGSKAVLRIEPVALQHPELLGLNIFNGYKENYIPATFSTLDKVLGPRWDVRKYSNSSYAAATSAEFSFNIQQCFITVKLKYAYIADEWTPLYRNYIQERLNEANQC